MVANIDWQSRNTEQALESCDIPSLDKFTLTLFMAIADRERELIGIRTKAALDEKLKKAGEWRKASRAFASGEAAAQGTRALQARARANENNKRAAAMVRYLRGTEVEKRDRAGEIIGTEPMPWDAIANRLNGAGFRASRGSAFTKGLLTDSRY